MAALPFWWQRSLLVLLGLLMGALLVLSVLALTGMPGRDSSAFLYVAQGILQGDMPYLDRWDHKPPLVYLLNVAGLLLMGGFWGVWLLQALFLLGTLALLLACCSRAFGVLPAALAGVYSLNAVLKFNDGGNLTELYALLFQWAGLYLFLVLEQRNRKQQPSNHLALALGLLGAMAALLRPNLVGPWLAIGLIWLARPRQRWPQMLAAGAAGLGLLAVAATIAMSLGIWPAMVDAVWDYNRAYAAVTSWQDRQQALLNLWQQLPLAPVLLAAWLASLVQLCRTAQPGSPLLPMVAILPAIDLALMALSGRSYDHYSLMLVPSAGLLLAWAAHSLFAATPPRLYLPMASLLVFVATTLPVSQQPAIRQAMMRLAEPDNMPAAERGMHQQAQAIRRHSQPGDAVLVWGAQAQLHLLSGTVAPGKLFYQYALVTPGYATPSMGQAFAKDLCQRPPVLIVDTNNPAMGPLDITSRHLRSTEPDPHYSTGLDTLTPLLALVQAWYLPMANQGGHRMYQLRTPRPALALCQQAEPARPSPTTSGDPQ